ncbi:MAG: LLM class flavin-dependent oxidoreductase [Candidatus Bathyarchaeia archaeon]|nr:LLM class flavin-dependent oxidoreductase [Candidatus Bathyarchaeota archaeon]
MKPLFGIHAPIHGSYGYWSFLELSSMADEMGFDYLTVGDHFFLPSETYARIGGDPAKPDKLDAWSVLSALAAKTERIRIGTRVSPIPFYLPSRLAKIVATADIISGGRAILGVGAGWHKDEAIAYGVKWGSHKERMERTLEGLEIILSLWLNEKTTFKGKYYQVLEAPLWPKPLQKPHPQIWFGGSSNAIINAAVKYGDGLFPLTDTPIEKLVDILQRLREAERKHGGKKPVMFAPAISYPSGIGKKSEWTSNIENCIRIGANLVLIDFTMEYAPLNEAKLFLKEFAKEVLPSFR